MGMELLYNNLYTLCPYINEEMSPLVCSSMWGTYGEWTFEENKIFEKYLALYDLNSMDLFEKIALEVPEKTIGQVRQHFRLLIEDINFIETYEDGIIINSDRSDINYYETTKRTTTKKIKRELSASRSQKYCVDDEQKPRKKGTRWTKEEHEKFLIGLRKYGKGDWRSISRNIVLTKTPTQVASHAQKYFIRLAKLLTPVVVSPTKSISQNHIHTASSPSPSFPVRRTTGAACLFHRRPPSPIL